MNGNEPYLSAAAALLRESGCTVVRWRKNMTGGAYTRRDTWDIEVPEPRGPVSYGTLAHEVAHQMLHRHGSKQRWEQEIEAWEWALATFERFQLPGRARCLDDATSAVAYSINKALRRTRNPEQRESLRLRILGRLSAEMRGEILSAA